MRIGLVHILPVFFLRRDIWPSPALPRLRVPLHHRRQCSQRWSSLRGHRPVLPRDCRHLCGMLEKMARLSPSTGRVFCALHRTALEHCLSLLGDLPLFLLIVDCIFVGSLVQLT